MRNNGPANFPAGTLIVNIAGCFLIGLLWGLGTRNAALPLQLQALLITGFCGGFTTFSAFTAESLDLMQHNRTGTFLLYASLSIVMGLLATYLGFRLTAK
jgi:CrcB protein